MFPALAGFLILGLSPSFVDWRQTQPGSVERREIVIYYAIALGLIAYGWRNRS